MSMMKYVREFRLIPVVLLATASLAALKLLGLLLDGGYLLTDLDSATVDRPIRVESDAGGAATVVTSKVVVRPSGASRTQPSMPQQSWAQETFGFPEITGSAAADRQAERNVERNAERTGASHGPEPAKPDPKPEILKPDKGPDGKVIELDAKPAPSPAERAILERLQERRQELDARSREIELRENLLKSAEKKYETRAGELRDQEANSPAALAKKEEAEAARLKNLVTMYENMKAKDAARIFDRLEMRILVEVASLINPRRMSDILGQMSAEAAERLTVELANRAMASVDRNTDAGNLPKIEGVPKN
jgi:flagellar motility protein MotE (MotC chaperone)